MALCRTGGKPLSESVMTKFPDTICHNGTVSWWRHQMETFSALLALCVGNSPVTREFPSQRPVTRSFDVFFDLRLNKRLNKQSGGWWFETLFRPLWRHSNDAKWKVTSCIHQQFRVLIQCLIQLIFKGDFFQWFFSDWSVIFFNQKRPFD